MEVMRKRGMNAINLKGGYKTQIRMEWVPKKGCTIFNIRSAMIGEVKTMQKADKKLRIISIMTGET